MFRSEYFACLALVVLALALPLPAAEEKAAAGETPAAAVNEETYVFRSDVALVRVDAQVVDRGNRAIRNLNAEDFVLFEQGKQQEIRNFVREDMPVDVVLLIDVSGSMRPHVQRLADASHQALQVMGADDRVAVMVFDRQTRVRLPFRKSVEEVEMALGHLLRQESFDGGTDITRALYDAASFVKRDGRREARKAVVILTDDQTERNREDDRVVRAFTSADAVLMALLTPDAMGTGGVYYPSGGGRQGGYGGYPGMGGPLGGALGGIIFGRGSPFPRGGGGGGPVIRSRTQSAGTAEIAHRSGGNSTNVENAYALQDTLERVRQRYALYFYLPPEARPGQERNIDVRLSDSARRRYNGAEVRFRQSYLAPDSAGNTPAVDPSPDTSAPVVSQAPEPEPEPRRRRAVNESRGSAGPLPAQSGGWKRVEDAGGATPSPSPGAQPASQEPPKKGGWRKLNPGEQP